MLCFTTTFINKILLTNTMTARKLIRELNPDVEEDVLLKGFVHEIRELKTIKFILLRDTSGIAQVVITKENPLFEKIPKLSLESVIEVHGRVKKSSISKSGFEIEAKEINILSKAEKLPITVTEKGVKISLPKRLDFRSVDLRKPENQALFKIQAALIRGMQEYLDNNGFLHVFTPALMGAPSESGSEVFEVKYYDKKAFLRQDPQLHRQLTIAGGFEKIYDLGTNWRAEKSHTTKHLCEHHACAVEMAYIESEYDTMKVEEELIISALKRVKKDCKEELKILNVDFEIPERPFLVLEFPKVYDILEEMGKKLNFGDDLDAEADSLIWQYVNKKLHKEFYFINKFPFALKPFYVMRYDDQPEYARSVDLNFRGLELSSGGQREHRYDKIMAQVKEKNLNPKSVEWFTKFFKWGVPPHGGFALGIERLTQALLKIDNIRKTVLFPRTPDRFLP